MKKLTWPEKINDVGSFVKKVSKKLNSNLIAVIMSGSGITNDYKEGWSDVDLTFIVKQKIYILNTLIINSHGKTFVTLEEYKRECRNKTVWAYMLNMGGIIYLNDSSFKLKKPKLPSYDERWKILNNMLVAFKLRNYETDFYKKTRQLYHTLRHFVRYASMSHKNYETFPLLINEIINCVDSCIYLSSDESSELKKLFERILKIREAGNCLENVYLKLERDVLKFLNKFLLGYKI